MRPAPTNRVILHSSDCAAELFWGIGYEGMVFNAYQLKETGTWVYHDQAGMHLMEPKQVRLFGTAHNVQFNWVGELLVCETCDKRCEFHGFTPRAQQEMIRAFVTEHGAPQNWEFESWVLRDERRYHLRDYVKAEAVIEGGR